MYVCQFIAFLIRRLFPMSKSKTPTPPTRIVPISSLVFIPPVIPIELRDAAKKGQGTEYFQKFRLGDLILAFGLPKVAYDEGLKILN